jgi:DNA-binding transcriptional regulator YdaS (Cro superfamily)
MTNEALKRAAAKFPTLQSFAEALSTPERPVTYQMIQQWEKGDVPPRYCPAVERLSGLEVMRVELNKAGAEIWPEMAAQQIAPRNRRTDKPT